MQRLSLSSEGFHLIGVAVALAVVSVAVFVGFKVFTTTETPPTSKQQSTDSSEQTVKGPPIWRYNQQALAWEVTSGTAPACKEPYIFDVTPVDMAQVSAVGLPGAYRGFSYKAHGGFRLTDATKGFADIKVPVDAKLMNITRYYERIPGKDYELQYLIDFETDCGIAFRFDHLHTLTPAFQAHADKSPEPKKDDTSGNPNIVPIGQLFKAGEVIATRGGFPGAQNYGFDFGVYDYRERNTISRNKQWAPLHESFSAQHFHGVCWLPMLPGADAVLAEAMAKDRRNYNSSKPFYLTSDYCDIAPYNSLDFNNGQPTDG